MNFNERVYEIVRRVPKGKVISYGQVAFLAGSPRGARAVGWALHRNPYPWVMGGENPVPCHRVVNREGRFTPEGKHITEDTPNDNEDDITLKAKWSAKTDMWI